MMDADSLGGTVETVKRPMQNARAGKRGVLLAFACGAVWAAGCAGGAEYAVGDIGPGGGTVFHVDSEGFACGETLSDVCHHLEAAPADADVERRWAETAYESVVADGADDPSVGAGLRNTTGLLAQGSTDPATSAAAYAAAYDLNGFDDWYLPSKDELFELYAKREAVHADGGANYWSSTGYDLNTAWVQSFVDGPQYRQLKFSSAIVRPIRAF